MTRGRFHGCMIQRRSDQSKAGRHADDSIVTGAREEINEPINLIDGQYVDYAAIPPEDNEQSFDLLSRRGHRCNSPIDSEVDDAQIVGMLASLLYIQEREREASADLFRVYHSNRENSASSSSFFRSSAGKLAPKFSHKRKSSTELHSDTRGIFGEHQQVQELLELRAHEAAREEQEALSRLSEAQFRTKILLEEQRSHILSEATFEIPLQETRAEQATVLYKT